MSELDPVTFLIATELLADSDRETAPRRPALVHPHTVGLPALVLLAHGSKDPDDNATFEDLCLRAQRDFGPSSVHIAYLQFNSPSLSEVIEDLLSQRIHQVRVLPLFLSDSSHVADDIPELISDLQKRYASLDIELLPALNEDARLRRLLLQIVRENALPEWLAKTS